LADTSQGFFERTSANDAIQFIIETLGTHTYALDVLAAFLGHGELTVCHASELTDVFTS
jgi:hypothetical protein